MTIRPAIYADVDAAESIYDSAREFMKNNGNPTQWDSTYPGRKDIVEGIELGVSYVCCDGDEVVATFHFETDAHERVYEEIDGKWKNDAPYAVIHRIAVRHHGKGIVDFCFSECFKRFPNLKIDTHRDNIPMQKCLLRTGFEHCGTVYLPDGSERLAYQKTK